MNQGVEAFPLCWPENHPRIKRRCDARFRTTLAKARDGLLVELQRMGARNVVLSTNVPLRRDGLPYAGQKQPDDPGVAVYFTKGGKPTCIPCDKWRKIEDNIWAIAKSVEALRGLERWAGSNFVDASFRGFQELPPPEDSCWSVLDIPMKATEAQILASYREKVKALHPDNGGNGDLDRIVKAKDKALRSIDHASQSNKEQ